MGETRSTCPYCGVGCGVVIEHEADRITGVRGDPTIRRISASSAPGATLHRRRRHRRWRRASRTLCGARRRTLRRSASSGTLRRRRGRPVRGVHSRPWSRQRGVLHPGQLLTEDYYVFNKLAKGLIGTNNIDTNSRLCMSSAVAGYKQTLGADAPPACYEDIDFAQCLFIAGSNTAWAHPVLYRRIEAARARNPDLKLIVVDPRKTVTASAADLHLAIEPGTDVALFNAMLHLLLWDDLVDRAFLAAHTSGFDALKATCANTRRGLSRKSAGSPKPISPPPRAGSRPGLRYRLLPGAQPVIGGDREKCGADQSPPGDGADRQAEARDRSRLPGSRTRWAAGKWVAWPTCCPRIASSTILRTARRLPRSGTWPRCPHRPG